MLWFQASAPVPLFSRASRLYTGLRAAVQINTRRHNFVRAKKLSHASFISKIPPLTCSHRSFGWPEPDMPATPLIIFLRFSSTTQNMPQIIPDDVVALGRVYGFSVEGYVNFEPQRERRKVLDSTPLMNTLESAKSATEPAPRETAGSAAAPDGDGSKRDDH